MKNLTKPHPRRPAWLYRVMMAFLGLFDRWLHLSCRSFIHTASQKYERPLRPGEKVRQSLHRAMCEICRVQEQHMDQLRELSHDIGRSDEDDPDVTLSDEATERIRLAMSAAERERSSDG